MPQITPPAESSRLEEYARDLARQFHERALVVVSPPASVVNGTVSAIPYAVLLSQSCPAELAAPGTRCFSPRGHEVDVGRMVRAIERRKRHG